MAGKGQAASADKKRQVLDVQAIASVGQCRRRREGQPTAAALRGETGKFKPRRRAAEEAPARRQRKAARGPDEVEIAGRGAGGGRQLDAGDCLPGGFGPGELGESGEDLRAPEVSDLEGDLEALKSVGVYGHPVAVRRNRERLLALGGGGVRFRLKSAGQLREHKRRQIVEIGRAENEIASRQRIGANGQRAREPRRSETEPKIVDGPAAIVVSCV